MRVIRSLLSRLLARTRITDLTSCWLWSGCVNGDGYGVIREGGRGSRLLLVHRALYELMVGAIPEGMEIDHACEVRNCINPAHLAACTPEENKSRRYGHRDAASGVRNLSARDLEDLNALLLAGAV
jgi:hypothetical protein